MITYRINSALLEAVGQHTLRYQGMQTALAEYTRKIHERELAHLLATQEAARLLRNYNYARDTELIRNAEFYESIKEQRLLARHTVRGIFVDRYI